MTSQRESEAEAPVRHPLWAPCRCGGFWCSVHAMHASECPCPERALMDFNPYSEGGRPLTADWDAVWARC
jgi:hypothetical protein